METSDDYQQAYAKALQLLKLRPHSVREMNRKLTLRSFNAETVAAVTQTLVQEGLINDAEFAQLYLDSLLRFKTFGFYGLKAKLMLRGIASHEAERLLKENLSIELETQIARQEAEKSRVTDRVKLAQRLSRKGFRSEVIREIINKE